MTKITMPKNSALLEEIEAALAIYYDENDWLSNNVYKTRLKKAIGEHQYSSSYTKKAQILSYFGFVVWEDPSDSRSKRRITASGREFYLNIMRKNEGGIQKNLLDSIEKNIFGKNVCGCPSSNSNVEPPALCIRAILDLDYITYTEFAFLLWNLADKGEDYNKSVSIIKQARQKRLPLKIPSEANQYMDAKPIMTLVRWGFLSEIPGRSKHITINKNVLDNYKERLLKLSIYNDKKQPREEKFTIDVPQVDEIEDLYDYVDEQHNKTVEKAAILDENSKILHDLNNRKPESIYTKNGKKYKTDPRLIKTANKINNYHCAINGSHKTFKLNSSIDYIEGHHIVPMKAQKDFEPNLDRTENITSLCPNCHKAIHFAASEYRKELLKIIYTDSRKSALKKIGIDISLEELNKKYYK